MFSLSIATIYPLCQLSFVKNINYPNLHLSTLPENYS